MKESIEMKKLLTLLFTFSISISQYGQNQKLIDSLFQLTESTISEKDKADAYISIAYEYSGIDSMKTNDFIARAIEIATRIDYERGLIDASYVLGRSSLLRGNYGKSEVIIEKVLRNSSRLDYKKGIANAYFAKGWLNYYKGDYDQSIKYHHQALEIRKNIGEELDVSNSLRGIGITYKLKGEFDRALYFLNESLSIEEKLGNKTGIAECLNHIGIINSLHGDYTSAMNSYLQALAIQEEVDDKSGLAYTYQNIGLILYHQKDYTKTLEYYNQSLNIRKEIGETRGIAQITYNIGVVFHDLGKYKEALGYYKEALEIKQQIGDKRGLADGYLNIGKLYMDQNEYQEAIEYQQQSLNISGEIGSDWGKVNALIALGRSHHGIGNILLSKKLLQEGLRLAIKARLQVSVREAAKLLSVAEKDLGNYQDAYEAQLLFQEMSDSLSNEEVTKRITRLEAEYQFQKERDSIQFSNEKQRLELDQKISEQRGIQIVTFIAIIILSTTIVILYRYYHLKNRSNKKLTQLNDEIKSTNKSLAALNREKNNLIGIVAHDLQNPLSNIINAVKLIGSKENEENQGQIVEIIKVSSARMHQMIIDILNVESIEKSTEEIELKAYNLSPMVYEVCGQFEKKAQAKSIEIKTLVEENILALVDERFVVQIIENLLSNAIKFSPKGSKIEVSLSNKFKKSSLEVKDEGPGLSEEDKRKLFQRFQRLSAKPTGNESSTGLGLSIVKKFVEAMKGRIWCESTLGHGANFIVEFQQVKNSD